MATSRGHPFTNIRVRILPPQTAAATWTNSKADRLFTPICLAASQVLAITLGAFVLDKDAEHRPEDG